MQEKYLGCVDVLVSVGLMSCGCDEQQGCFVFESFYRVKAV